MGQGRNGHIYAKFTLKWQLGIALVNALIFALLISAFITGLYIALNRLFKSTEEIRTFTSVREAAAAGARYAASMTNIPQRQTCQQLFLDFRITGRDGIGRTEIIICRIASDQFLTGQEISGTSREPVTAAASSKGGVFKIVSIARFPAGAPSPNQQTARVEAVYVK